MSTTDRNSALRSINRLLLLGALASALACAAKTVAPDAAKPWQRDPVLAAMAAQLPADYAFYLKGSLREIEAAKSQLEATQVGAALQARLGADEDAIGAALQKFRQTLPSLDAARPILAANFGARNPALLARVEVGLPGRKQDLQPGFHNRMLLPAIDVAKLAAELDQALTAQDDGSGKVAWRVQTADGFVIFDFAISAAKDNSDLKAWLETKLGAPKNPLVAQASPAVIDFFVGDGFAMHYVMASLRDIALSLGSAEVHDAVSDAPADQRDAIYAASAAIVLLGDSMFDANAREFHDATLRLSELAPSAAPQPGAETATPSAGVEVTSTTSLTANGQRIYNLNTTNAAMPGMLAEATVLQLQFAGLEAGILDRATIPVWLQEIISKAGRSPEGMQIFSKRISEAGTIGSSALFSSPVGTLAGVMQLLPPNPQIDMYRGLLPEAMILRIFAPKPRGEQATGIQDYLIRSAIAVRFPASSDPGILTGQLNQLVPPMLVQAYQLSWDVIEWQGAKVLRLASGMPMSDAFPAGAPAAQADATKPLQLSLATLAKAVQSSTADMGLQAMVAAVANYGDVTVESRFYGDHSRSRVSYRSPVSGALAALPHHWTAPAVPSDRSACTYGMQFIASEILNALATAPPDQKQAMFDTGSAQWLKASKCAAQFPDLSPPASYPQTLE